MAFLQCFRRVIGLATIALILIPVVSVRAQTGPKDTDPLATKDFKRTRAETPLEYGVIVGSRYNLAGSHGDGYDTKLTLDLDAYVDTWQVGYHIKEYGNVFRLSMRSFGADMYGSWFIETGSGSYNRTLYSDTGAENSRQVSQTFSVTGLGVSYSSGYDKDMSFAWDILLAAGGASGDQVGSGTGSTSSFYATLEAGIGTRIPIDFMALTLEAKFFSSILPTMGGNDPKGAVGVGLSASYAFNLGKY